MKNNLILRNRSHVLFFAIGLLVLTFLSFESWTLLVLTLYIGTAIYVYAFFNRKFNRGEQVYYYAGLMVLCIAAFPPIYRDLGIVDTTTNTNVSSRADLYYFSLVTWTTLGYGDLRPSIDSRMFAALQALLGYFYMSILVAKLFQWLNQVSETKTDMQSTTDTTEETR